MNENDNGKKLIRENNDFLSTLLLPHSAFFSFALTHCFLNNKRRKKLLKIMVKCSSVNAEQKARTIFAEGTHFIFFVCDFFSHEFHVTIVLQFDFVQTSDRSNASGSPKKDFFSANNKFE